MSQILSSVRVLDFCWVGAGSFATKMLADAGADVIKIESSASLDGLRLAAPFAGKVRGVNRSGYFADRNSSKRSVTINLKTEEGRGLARRLVAVSDVVANNFTPGVMERFGLGWDEVHRMNPSAVYLTMSMQGRDGPARDYLGYGITIAALTGLQHLTGEPGRVPIGTNTNYPDHIPNPAHAAFAVLAALRYRRRTGLGQCIDMAQTESTLTVLGAAIADFTANGVLEQAMGNDHTWRAPHGVYRCAGDDRWLAISVRSDNQWQRLCAALGLEPSVLAPGWEQMSARYQDRRRIDGLITAQTRTRSTDELVNALVGAGVPCAPVQDAAQVVADPQLAHRRHWARPHHPEMGDALYNAPPYSLSSTPVEISSAAPMLGEHTDEVCREVLGMSENEIDVLRSKGVLS